MTNFVSVDPEAHVRATYSAAAASPVADLCCPVQYDPRLLQAVPAEVRERDYGCGDPTPWIHPDETVLDLGSGGGKGVFLAAQVVGPKGKVIGVDMNEDMLALARRNTPAFARAVGFHNVKFLKGRIQDLALDLDRLDAWLGEHPVRSAADLGGLEAEQARLRREQPLVRAESVDVVVSDCVLNLVRPEEKAALFREIHRVLRRGGRAVISDIVSDVDVPAHLQADPALWTGCISGAMREDLFLQAFTDAGMYGAQILKRDVQPWRTVEGVEFRSVTVVAYKGKEGPCWDHKQAVIYKGPFREVHDDDGHRLVRGLPVAVCAKTFEIYGRAPYADHFERIAPRVPVPAEEVRPFPCGVDMLVRSAAERKGEGYDETTEAGALCTTPGCC